MSNQVDLPLAEPLYSTYHYQGIATAITGDNTSVRNWYLNEVMNLTCNRKFLNGFTTPEITIPNSSWSLNPYLDKQWCSTKFVKGNINKVIKEMLKQGYYAVYMGVDDYYLEGKTWYKQRHFSHDGLICGYNSEDKTYCIYAYDNNWIYKKFWVSQSSFEKGRKAMLKKGTVTTVCGLKVKGDRIQISPEKIYTKLKEYLDSNIKKYPFDAEGNVFGIVVHEYIAEYILKLHNGSIPYEKMDRRVFRLIWEHKKAMLERIRVLEDVLGLDKRYGDRYEQVVAQANNLRMLYASYHMRRRDSVLLVIREKLLQMAKQERRILNCVVKALGKELEKNAVGILKK